MNPVDLLVILAVLVAFIFCVRSIVRSNRSGACADCAQGGSCTAHNGGSCLESEKLMASAAAAAARHKK